MSYYLYFYNKINQEGGMVPKDATTKDTTKDTTPEPKTWMEIIRGVNDSVSESLNSIGAQARPYVESTVKSLDSLGTQARPYVQSLTQQATNLTTTVSKISSEYYEKAKEYLNPKDNELILDYAETLIKLLERCEPLSYDNEILDELKLLVSISQSILKSEKIDERTKANLLTYFYVFDKCSKKIPKKNSFLKKNIEILILFILRNFFKQFNINQLEILSLKQEIINKSIAKLQNIQERLISELFRTKRNHIEYLKLLKSIISKMKEKLNTEVLTNIIFLDLLLLQVNRYLMEYDEINHDYKYNLELIKQKQSDSTIKEQKLNKLKKLNENIEKFNFYFYKKLNLDDYDILPNKYYSFILDFNFIILLQKLSYLCFKNTFKI